MGCDPLAVLGVEELVTEKDALEAPPPIADDRIEDKHPVYVPSAIYEETIDGCSVRLNKSGSIVKLDVLPFADADAALQTQVFPTWLAAAGKLTNKPILPSMEIVQAVMKPFNDGLYAAVELGAEDGSDGATIDKRGLFRDVLAALVAKGSTASAAWFAGAGKLAGESPTAPPEVLSQADTLVATFHGNAFASRPIGFYTWSSELESVFRRDRFLQGWWSPLPFAVAADTANALHDWADLRTRYQRALDLYAGMTGPYRDVSPIALAALLPTSDLQAAAQAKYPDLLAATPECAAGYGLLPSSDTAENRLFRARYCSIVLPAGTNLLDVLINDIRAGKVDLTPRADAGWSDLQLYALETLLVPERATEKDHLFLTRRYKEKLIETFKTIVIQNRETHVKQIGITMSSSVSAVTQPRPVDIHPNLPVEPFPTFYLRTARAYRFVENLLRATMGDAWLSSAHRVREGGARASKSIGAELQDMELLLYGLHALSARAIGSTIELGDGDLPFSPDMLARAKKLAADFTQEPDVASDPRVIVPVLVDPERKETHYWALIGVRALPIRAEFYPGFEPKDITVGTQASGFGSCYFRQFKRQEPYILIGKSAELVLPSSKPPPTRAQLRKACDENSTVQGIQDALSR